MVLLTGSMSELFPGVTLALPLVLDVQSVLALMANVIRSHRAIWDHSTIHYVGSILCDVGLRRSSSLDYWNYLHDTRDMVGPAP